MLQNNCPLEPALKIMIIDISNLTFECQVTISPNQTINPTYVNSFPLKRPSARIILTY